MATKVGFWKRGQILESIDFFGMDSGQQHETVPIDDVAKESDRKPWKHLLIPHDAITDQMTLAGLAARYTRMNRRQGSGE